MKVNDLVPIYLVLWPSLFVKIMVDLDLFYDKVNFTSYCKILYCEDMHEMYRHPKFQNHFNRTFWIDAQFATNVVFFFFFKSINRFWIYDHCGKLHLYYYIIFTFYKIHILNFV